MRKRSISSVAMASAMPRSCVMRAKGTVCTSAASAAKVAPTMPVATTTSTSVNPARTRRGRAISDGRRELVNRRDHRDGEHAYHDPDEEHQDRLDDGREVLRLLGHIGLVQLSDLLQHLGNFARLLSHCDHVAHLYGIELRVLGKCRREGPAFFYRGFSALDDRREASGTHRLTGNGECLKHRHARGKQGGEGTCGTRGIGLAYELADDREMEGEHGYGVFTWVRSDECHDPA